MNINSPSRREVLNTRRVLEERNAMVDGESERILDYIQHPHADRFSSNNAIKDGKADGDRS